MSAASDERAAGLARLDDLKRAQSALADKRDALVVQLLDRRPTVEDQNALNLADTKLGELKALIAEGEHLLGIDAPPDATP